jgi:hypothetical protein
MMPIFLFLSSLALLRSGLWLVSVVRNVPRRNADLGWPQ